MNNKKQTKQPLFAEVNLTGDEFRQSPSNHMQRTRFLTQNGGRVWLMVRADWTDEMLAD